MILWSWLTHAKNILLSCKKNRAPKFFIFLNLEISFLLFMRTSTFNTHLLHIIKDNVMERCKCRKWNSYQFHLKCGVAYVETNYNVQIQVYRSQSNMRKKHLIGKKEMYHKDINMICAIDMLIKPQSNVFVVVAFMWPVFMYVSV